MLLVDSLEFMCVFISTYAILLSKFIFTQVCIISSPCAGADTATGADTANSEQVSISTDPKTPHTRVAIDRALAILPAL